MLSKKFNNIRILFLIFIYTFVSLTSIFNPLILAKASENKYIDIIKVEGKKSGNKIIIQVHCRIPTTKTSKPQINSCWQKIINNKDYSMIGVGDDIAVPIVYPRFENLYRWAAPANDTKSYRWMTNNNWKIVNLAQEEEKTYTEVKKSDKIFEWTDSDGKKYSIKANDLKKADFPVNTGYKSLAEYYKVGKNYSTDWEAYQGAIDKNKRCLGSMQRYPVNHAFNDESTWTLHPDYRNSPPKIVHDKSGKVIGANGEPIGQDSIFIAGYGYDYYVILQSEVEIKTPTPDPDPSDPGSGDIIFRPNECDWTNKGKTGEGKGAYPVDVIFRGKDPEKGTGTYKYKVTVGSGKDKHQETREGTFSCSWPFKGITVSGATNERINGTRGTVNIKQEGGNQQLSAQGEYGARQGKPPSKATSTKYPKDPKNPSGKSGKYNIDWTKPEIHIDEPNKKWVNEPVPYPVEVSSKDNLSGFAEGSNVTVDDISHYERDASDDLPVAALDYSKTIELDDGMYDINFVSNDRAGNENSDSKSRYLIDGTKPEVTFNVEPGIFSVDRGAVRKKSVKGIDDGFFGTLTFNDNLSGVAKLQYGWTFGDNEKDCKYDVIYTSPYTYEDRYDETIDREIEKPVGDNLYMHIRLWDTAGNETYQCFGPYEDPIKLRDFEITDIRDPIWDNVFWKGDFIAPTKKAYKVNQLPIDKDSNPLFTNSTVKKGYAFYFDITSEYLYRDEDKIVITPTFFHYDGVKQTPVDVYYQLDNNPFIKIGSAADNVGLNMDTKLGRVSIGGLNELILTKGVRIHKGRPYYKKEKGWEGEIQYKDGKEQYWYGKYFIPATSIIVPKGKDPRPENRIEDGSILINFQIIAYKNGIETFSSDQIYTYVPTQWKEEGGPKSPKYNPGDVILFDNKYSALDDFKTYVTY